MGKYSASEDFWNSDEEDESYETVPIFPEKRLCDAAEEVDEVYDKLKHYIEYNNLNMLNNYKCRYKLYNWFVNN